MDPQCEKILSENLKLSAGVVRSLKPLCKDTRVSGHVSALLERAKVHHLATQASPAPITANSQENQDAEKEKHECTACDRLTAKYCSRCAGAPSNERRSYYCSVECQKSDFPNHKSRCQKDHIEKAMHRIGDFAKRVWYTIREETCDVTVKRAAFDKGKLSIWDDWQHFPIGIGPFYPPKIFDKPEQRLLRGALLSEGLCADAMIIVTHMLQELLGGIGQRYQAAELQFSPKNVVLPVQVYDPNGKLQSRDIGPQELGAGIHMIDLGSQMQQLESGVGGHFVLRVTFPQKNQGFIIDPTGEQYGWQESIMDADLYTKQRVIKWLSTGSSPAFGTQRKECVSGERYGLSDALTMMLGGMKIKLVKYYTINIVKISDWIFDEWLRSFNAPSAKSFLLSSQAMLESKTVELQTKLGLKLNKWVLEQLAHRYDAATSKECKQILDGEEFNLKEVGGPLFKKQHDQFLATRAKYG